MRISTVTTAGLILASSAAAAALPRTDSTQVSGADEPRGISLDKIASSAEAAFHEGKDPHHDVKGHKENKGMGSGVGAGKPKNEHRGIDLGKVASSAASAFREGKDPHHDVKGHKENKGTGSGVGKPKKDDRRSYDEEDSIIDEDKTHNETAFGGPDPWEACRMM
ncbi:hypothetical protein UCREL1_7832 [Eutypa lata UCREL1]|uniref:Uncharacterized protein n=1 Tax=Eutypa lata (strain UCR-EL1) TaxID=1287681 RepID=M7SLE4_EUTLA|nr:hypothetical protein UCREL1_7832 [Eutypa lata UCREL1]